MELRPLLLQCQLHAAECNYSCACLPTMLFAVLLQPWLADDAPARGAAAR